MTALADVRTIARYVVTHIDAGHGDPSDDKFDELLTDLGTLVTNANRVRYSYLPPATIDERLSYIVSTVAAIAAEQADLVSQIAQDTDTAVKAAADRVIAALANVATLTAERDAALAAQATAEAASAQATADLAAKQAELDAAVLDAATDNTTLTGTIAVANTIAPTP